MNAYDQDRLELGPRIAWQLLRDRDVQTVETWLTLRQGTPWQHKGQGTLL